MYLSICALKATAKSRAIVMARAVAQRGDRLVIKLSS
jgi:hypothetical protein